ncbi:MAG: response regulator [Thiohalomonadales bacterium]
MKNNSNQNPLFQKTLLVVDDEKSIVALASELFTAQGYNVLTAYDGEQALSVIKSQSVDLLLCDVVMPNLNGWQLASLVRKSYPNIKIQMISGFPDEDHPTTKDDDLFQNLLHKPFSSISLVERIQNLNAKPEKLEKKSVVEIVEPQ